MFLQNQHLLHIQLWSTVLSVDNNQSTYVTIIDTIIKTMDELFVDRK